MQNCAKGLLGSVNLHIHGSKHKFRHVYRQLTHAHTWRVYDLIPEVPNCGLFCNRCLLPSVYVLHALLKEVKRKKHSCHTMEHVPSWEDIYDPQKNMYYFPLWGRRDVGGVECYCFLWSKWAKPAPIQFVFVREQFPMPGLGYLILKSELTWQWLMPED